jgi:4'-phosphopantetheinyl transferase
VEDIHFNTTLGEIIVSFRTKSQELKKRKFEKAEIQKILDLLKIPAEVLCYGPLGNPLLSLEDKFVSFSHSEGWFAVYLGNTKLGIDIQVFHQRISDGKSYFINQNEQQWASDLDLHVVWAAKEAIFKKHGGEMIDLAKEVSISEIDHENQTIKATFNTQIEHLKFELFEKTILAYTIN